MRFPFIGLAGVFAFFSVKSLTTGVAQLRGGSDEGWLADDVQILRSNSARSDWIFSLDGSDLGMVNGLAEMILSTCLSVVGVHA